MNRTLLALTFFSSLAGGCAALDGNFVGGTTPTPNTSKSESKGYVYEPMQSQPPAPLKEDQPALAAGEVWVPGYYQPVAGNWLWHQGQVQSQKDGYKLLPASYREEGGKVYFSPPRWRRADLAEKK
jgi:hypothetical protein